MGSHKKLHETKTKKHTKQKPEILVIHLLQKSNHIQYCYQTLELMQIHWYLWSTFILAVIPYPTDQNIAFYVTCVPITIVSSSSAPKRNDITFLINYYAKGPPLLWILSGFLLLSFVFWPIPRVQPDLPKERDTWLHLALRGNGRLGRSVSSTPLPRMPLTASLRKIKDSWLCRYLSSWSGGREPLLYTKRQLLLKIAFHPSLGKHSAPVSH